MNPCMPADLTNACTIVHMLSHFKIHLWCRHAVTFPDALSTRDCLIFFARSTIWLWWHNDNFIVSPPGHHTRSPQYHGQSHTRGARNTIGGQSHVSVHCNYPSWGEVIIIKLLKIKFKCCCLSLWVENMVKDMKWLQVHLKMRILSEKRRLFLLVLTFTFSSDGLKTKLRKHVRRKSEVTSTESDKERAIHNSS